MKKYNAQPDIIVHALYNIQVLGNLAACGVITDAYLAIWVNHGSCIAHQEIRFHKNSLKYVLLRCQELFLGNYDLVQKALSTPITFDQDHYSEKVWRTLCSSCEATLKSVEHEKCCRKHANLHGESRNRLLVLSESTWGWSN